MNYLISDYFYPLQKQIVLSKKHNFILDNPRTEDEINFVTQLIKKNHSDSKIFRFPPRADKRFVSLAGMLKSISKFYSDDLYFSKIYSTYFSSKSHDSVYNFLARILIITRFDDQGESQRLKKARLEMKKNNEKGIFLLDDDNPMFKSSELLFDFSHVISLLINTDQEYYNGKSFLYNYDSYHNYNNFKFSKSLLYLSFSCFPKKKKDTVYWEIFPLVKNSLLKTIEKIEIFSNTNDTEGLFYVANILKIANNDAKDPKLKIILLTSIIEFMLTHNPDSNRFNVEDSINKQFQLKTSIIIYQFNKNQDLKIVKNNLNFIYKIRSCIAHGNISDLNKVIKKENIHKEKFFLEKQVHLLYKYLRIIICEYLKDPKFFNYLKKA